MNSLAPRFCTLGCGRKVFAKGFCTAHYIRIRRHGDAGHGGDLRPISNRTSSTAHNDFLAKALASETDQCVLWPFGKRGSYGKSNRQGTHRIVCTKAHGCAPSTKHEAAHSCGVPECVNPRHLRWALPKENCADRLLHGTHVLGEKCGTSKLTEVQVRDIRRLAGVVTGAELSRRFGVGQMQISRIVRRQQWGWLDE